MTSKKPSAKTPVKKKTEKTVRGRGGKATPVAAEAVPYPRDLGMRWFHQKANLPPEVISLAEPEEEVPSGRLRLTRSGRGG